MGRTASRLSLQASSRLAFRERYMRRFLPLLSCVREKCATKRYEAVKKVADFSLACAAGRTSWSKALCRSLYMRMNQDRSSVGFVASKGGPTFLRRLRRRRMWARAQAVGYGKSFSVAQREYAKPKPINKGTRATKKPAVVQPGADLEDAKLSSLSELIPGGLYMDLPKLLDQTAHYIISLQLQVDALAFLGRALSTSGCT